MRELSLDRLRTLVAIADLGSFVAAVASYLVLRLSPSPSPSPDPAADG